MSKETFAYTLGAIHRSDFQNNSVSILDSFREFEASSWIEMLITAEDSLLENGFFDPIIDNFPVQRIAPVQLTIGWDPREYLNTILKDDNNLSPIAMNEENGGILYYSSPNLIDHPVPEPILQNHKDYLRFNELLKLTLTTLKKLNHGFIFIGAWGWDYDLNNTISVHEAKIMEQYGMLLTNRHL